MGSGKGEAGGMGNARSGARSGSAGSSRLLVEMAQTNLNDPCGQKLYEGLTHVWLE